MRLPQEVRISLAKAIFANINGERLFQSNMDGLSIGEYTRRMGAWATRIQDGTDNENDRRALRWVASLPYTQPCIDDDSNEEEISEMKDFLFALYCVQETVFFECVSNPVEKILDLIA